MPASPVLVPGVDQPIPASADFEVVTDFGTERLDEVMAVFAHAWWTEHRSRDEVAAMLSATPVTAGLHCPRRGRLIGFGRAFSDGVYKALLMDVVVETDLRGHGVGAHLVNALLSHPLVAGVGDVELYTKPARTRFYTDLGFQIPENQQLMRRSRP